MHKYKFGLIFWLTSVISFALSGCNSESTGIAQGRSETYGQVSLFTKVGDPGSPEGVAVRDGKVYVATHLPLTGNAGQGPSKIFIYDVRSGKSLDEITISGQVLSADHGLLAMTFGPDKRLYVVDQNPARILAFDVSRKLYSQATFAELPDLKPCLLSLLLNPTAACSPTFEDFPAYPDFIEFDLAGNAYVTDLQAATIFRIPHGSNVPEVWFQSQMFESPLGLNGIAVSPDAKSLFFSLTAAPPFNTQGLAAGVIYKLPLKDSPSADELEVFHTYEVASSPDGIIFGASGRLYVALAGSNQVSILAADGSEMDRISAPAGSEQVVFDSPASLAFDALGGLLVTNQSSVMSNRANWTVLKINVGDVGR